MGRLTHGPCATGASPEDRPLSTEKVDPNLSQPHSSPCWRLGAPRGHWCLHPQRRGWQAAPSLGAAVMPEAQAERAAERKGQEGPAALDFPGEREPVRSTCKATGRQERGEPSEAGASASAGGWCTCRTGVTWGQETEGEETRSWEALKAIIGGWALSYTSR